MSTLCLFAPSNSYPDSFDFSSPGQRLRNSISVGYYIYWLNIAKPAKMIQHINRSIGDPFAGFSFLFYIYQHFAI